MGLFNKLKNALFEEEEIELEQTPEKVVINEESVPKKKEVEPTKTLPLENERELFKAENTFNFPDFDEEEFVTNYESSKPKPVEKKEVRPIIENRKPDYEKPKTNLRTSSYDTYEYEQKPKAARETVVRRERISITEKEPEKKAFRPSPVISPVYGVLDKDYSKEDFVAAKKTTKPKTTLDVDKAIKKAFGTLEDDIEKTLSEPTKKFYREDTKSIDELLKDSIDDTIELKPEKEEIVLDDNTFENDTEELKDFNTNIEEALSMQDENLEIIEETPKKNKKSENYLEENTLESDLFDLIDSMYDSREEE